MDKYYNPSSFKLTSAEIGSLWRSYIFESIVHHVFEKENPPPRGTTSEDVNANAPRLFSDKFYIAHIRNMANFALLNFTMAYAKSSCDDIRKLFKDKMNRLQKVDQIGSNNDFKGCLCQATPYRHS